MVRLLIILLLLSNSLAVFAENTAPVSNADNKAPAKEELSNINLQIKNDEKQTIKISEPVKKIDGKIFATDQEKMQQAFQIQKKIDIEDIRNLWEATVDRNSVIKFALKKLAMPPEQRRIHSSIMAKTVATLISGASILPNILGADTYTSTATAAGGSLASRIISNSNKPKDMPLTDTELLQLAKLIEDLQNKLINNYYDYKSSIEAIKVCRQNIILQNKNYSDAINTNNTIGIIASSSLYDKELLNELKLKQQIKLDRLELERLAGAETVDKLTLTQMAVLNDSKIQNKDVSTKGEGK